MTFGQPAWLLLLVAVAALAARYGLLVRRRRRDVVRVTALDLLESVIPARPGGPGISPPPGSCSRWCC